MGPDRPRRRPEGGARLARRAVRGAAGDPAARLSATRRGHGRRATGRGVARTGSRRLGAPAPRPAPGGARAGPRYRDRRPGSHSPGRPGWRPMRASARTGASSSTTPLLALLRVERPPSERETDGHDGPRARASAPPPPICGTPRARAVGGSLGAGALSLAIFTDSQAVTGNAFATGTIDISTTPATALFSVSNMMPGDTNSQTIQVSNAGTGALRYAISTAVVTGPTLAAQLQLDVYAGATCTGTALYSGALDRCRRQRHAGPAGGRPAAGRRHQRDALLQGDASARHRQLLPEHLDRRDLHICCRAERQQPVRASRPVATAGAAGRGPCSIPAAAARADPPGPLR